MLTLTLENIPAHLHARLKQSDEKNRRSLNSEILTRLERDVSVPKVDEGGWNVNALIVTGFGALFSSVLPNMTNLLPSWWGTYGWFLGVAIGGTVYYVLSMVRPRTVPAANAS